MKEQTTDYDLDSLSTEECVTLVSDINAGKIYMCLTTSKIYRAVHHASSALLMARENGPSFMNE